MKIKDTKITYFVFLAYECAAAEEYLELMAGNGWLLESVKGPFLKFKRIEPQKIKYSVDVFDHKDINMVLEYREYCKTAGRNYICQKGGIQIFYTEDEKKIISIHTDEEEKFKTVFKASLWFVLGQFTFISLIVFNLYINLFVQNSGPIIESNLEILSFATIFFILLTSVVGVIRFCFWVIKAKRQLKENKFMPYNSYKQIMIKNILTKSYGVIMLILLLKFSSFDNISSNKINISLLIIICVPMIIQFCLYKVIHRKRPSKNISMFITMCSRLLSIYLVLTLAYTVVFSRLTTVEQNKAQTDKISLAVADFGFKEDENVSPYISYDRSILCQRIQYSSSNENNQFNYNSYQSQYTWVINYEKDRLLSDLNEHGVHLEQVNTTLPSSIDVYSYSGEKKYFIVIAQDKVLQITKGFGGISDDEFLDKVYKNFFINR